MLTTAERPGVFDELRKLDEAWQQNNKAHKRQEVYTVSHKLLGLIMVTWAKDVVKEHERQLTTVFADEKQVTITKSSGVKKIIDVEKARAKSLERKHDPETGRFIKTPKVGEKKRR
jgi:hypothetical protein